MANAAIRVTFTDEETAYGRWEDFGDAVPEFVNDTARKRDGASYVLLLRELSESEIEAFQTWCRTQPGVTGVGRMTESEFWAAPSHGVPC